MITEKLNTAINILWVQRDYARGQEAMQLFEEEAAAGNGDAYFFMARCYLGSSFVSDRFNFKEDEEKGKELLDKGLEAGSVLTMFGARRLAGYTPKNGTFVQPPYHSDEEIFAEVQKMAEQNVFVKYLVANAYYYNDVIQFFGIDKKPVSQKELAKYLNTWANTAAKMYEEILNAGCLLCVSNYLDIVRSGDYGIAIDEAKARKIEEKAADLDSTYYQIMVGRRLMNTDPERAKKYFARAAELGEGNGYYFLGFMCGVNSKNPDYPKSIAYMEKAMEYEIVAGTAMAKIGEIYFYGGYGVEQDYEKAFYYFKEAKEKDEETNWYYDMLGTCYLMFARDDADYRMAKACFIKQSEKRLSLIGMGKIYAFGLGEPENIAMGMKYWNTLSGDPEVKELKKKFKKPLFGAWRRVEE